MESARDRRAEALVASFERAGYTIAGVRELLGPVAGGALARDEVVPALRATRAFLAAERPKR